MQDETFRERDFNYIYFPKKLNQSQSQSSYYYQRSFIVDIIHLVDDGLLLNQHCINIEFLIELQQFAVNFQKFARLRRLQILWIEQILLAKVLGRLNPFQFHIFVPILGLSENLKK